MRTITTRTLASVLAALLTGSCGTVKESRQPDIEELVFLPRAPRAVASPVVEEPELRRAIEELLPYVNVEEARTELRRMVADPRFHGRQPGELRIILASWGSGPEALEEIGREYRAWCAAVRRTNCHEEPLTDSSIYEIAFDFAMGARWDGFVGEVESTIDPSTIRIVLLTGLVIFMASIAIPELMSKIPAAAATMVLTAYLGAQAVCDLVFGWIRMVRELDAAATFDEVRAAGQRYGRLIGAQTARILIMLATAAVAEGGLIARLMKLPRATQASAALAAETGGVGLQAAGRINEARVLQSGVAITVEGVAKGAVGVAMAAHGAPGQPGQPVPEPTTEAPQRGPHSTEGPPRLKMFEKLGIKTTDHFRNRLARRASRGITEANALDAYRNGRLFYSEATKNYIRHSSRTGVSVVTDAPAGGRAITVFEGKPSPDWMPIPWRPGL